MKPIEREIIPIIIQVLTKYTDVQSRPSHISKSILETSSQRKDILKLIGSVIGRKIEESFESDLPKKASELNTLFCEKKKETSEVIARLLTSDEQDQLISIFEKIDRKF